VNYGFIIPRGDPRTVAELAREAEEAGWDGAFYWDGISIGEMETYDPWVVMAAMAMRTGSGPLPSCVPSPRLASRGGWSPGGRPPTSLRTCGPA
jgi:Luciferase-like monooxygenase